MSASLDTATNVANADHVAPAPTRSDLVWSALGRAWWIWLALLTIGVFTIVVPAPAPDQDRDRAIILGTAFLALLIGAASVRRWPPVLPTPAQVAKKGREEIRDREAMRRNWIVRSLWVGYHTVAVMTLLTMLIYHVHGPAVGPWGSVMNILYPWAIDVPRVQLEQMGIGQFLMNHVPPMAVLFAGIALGGQLVFWILGHLARGISSARRIYAERTATIQAGGSSHV